ncbi:protein of unknown function [Cardinium endosymbiont cEper1 of Encarsia pergandiella]|nr:protein of unknown function [Cardinium endosymbiont cEper1 of Encarsia pergandiella]
MYPYFCNCLKKQVNFSLRKKHLTSKCKLHLIKIKSRMLFFSTKMQFIYLNDGLDDKKWVSKYLYFVFTL